MDKHTSKSSREERLAAKLRENLRRRKVQGRELDEADGHPHPEPALFKPTGHG